MKEPDIEGITNRDDPESGAGAREGGGEARTGARAGRVLSRESPMSWGADAVMIGGRQHGHGRQREDVNDPAWSKTPSTHGTSLRENREVSGTSGLDGRPERAGKAGTPKPATYEPEKSDEPIVPTKLPNKAAQRAAEVVEGRGSAKGNTDEQNAFRTQRRGNAQSALERVREAAKRERKQKFTALFHHVTLERLRAAYLALKRRAAAGTDGETWEQYGQGLEERLVDLHDRLRRGAYRAKPSRRVYIPKADGRQRPIGIATVEDKIVQRATVEVLNAIYEADFLGFSYGFRPRRSQHQALDALAVAIRRRKVDWVLDVDIRGFFDSIDHGWLLKFVEHRVADRRVLRLIQKWLKAGILENGKWSETTAGTPQGATVSPLLANVYLHYVFDLWVEHWRKQQAHGDVIVVRYADDIVLGIQYEGDAMQLRQVLTQRMRKFGLELHPEKTRLLRFGRFAAARRRERGEGKPETFDFLGFTHICGMTKSGKFLLERHTARARMRARVAVVKEEIRKRRHLPVPEQGKWLGSVVRGYFAYHAVPTNSRKLGGFRARVIRHWYKALRRRGQRRPINWVKMSRLAKRWIPPAHILHPFPEQRFDATTQGGSRVR